MNLVSRDAPLALPQAVKAKLVRDLSSVHRVWQVLLVGKHEQKRVTELVLVEHALEFLARLRDTFTVVRVNDKDDALRVLEVWSAGTHSGARGDGSCPDHRHPTR